MVSIPSRERELCDTTDIYVASIEGIQKGIKKKGNNLEFWIAGSNVNGKARSVTNVIIRDQAIT